VKNKPDNNAKNSIDNRSLKPAKTDSERSDMTFSIFCLKNKTKQKN